MQRSFVIMLHRVQDPVWLDAILNDLKRRYHLVRAEKVKNFYEHSENQPFVHLTSDDGDLTFYENVFPVLQHHQAPATLFVSPSILREGSHYWFQKVNGMDKQRLKQVLLKHFSVPEEMIDQYGPKELLKMLPWREIDKIIHEYGKVEESHRIPDNISPEQLHEMLESGLVEPGAHTLNHPVLANESDETSEEEIIGSIKQLSELTEREIRYFAYPNGTPGLDFGDREMHYLKKAGIQLAFSTRVDHLHPDDHAFDVPRIGLTYGNRFFVQTKIRLGKSWSRIKKLRNRIRGVHRHDMIKTVKPYLVKNR